MRISEEPAKRLRVSDDISLKSVAVTHNPDEIAAALSDPVREAISGLVQLKSWDRVDTTTGVSTLVQSLLVSKHFDTESGHMLTFYAAKG